MEEEEDVEVVEDEDEEEEEEEAFFNSSIALTNLMRGPILKPISLRWSSSRSTKSGNSTSFSSKIFVMLSACDSPNKPRRKENRVMVGVGVEEGGETDAVVGATNAAGRAPEKAGAGVEAVAVVVAVPARAPLAKELRLMGLRRGMGASN